MDIKTRRKEKGYLIEVEADEEIALVVQSENGERIYLPGEQGSDSTYYHENPTFLAKTDKGYAVLHSEKPENIQVVS